MSSKRTKKIAAGTVLVGALVAGPITLAHTSAFAGSGSHSGGSGHSSSGSHNGSSSSSHHGYHGSYSGYNSSYRGGLGRNPNNDTTGQRDNSHYDSRYQDQFAEH